MDKDKKNLNKKNLPASRGEPWWKPGMAILSEVSTWIVAPIILALVGGKYLDNRYNTKPYFFFILIGIAFLVTAFGIVKAVRNYIKTLKEVEKK